MMKRSFLMRAYRGLFRHAAWNIGIVRAPISVFLEPSARPRICWLPPTELGKFLADPFAVLRHGKLYILCEEFSYRTGKGRIVSIELVDWQHPSKPKVAIELPVHLSYPYLLEHLGEIYCIPETAQAREISLYKAEEFPHKWIKMASLIQNFPGLDATVFRHGGCWWLTCTKDGSPVDRSSLFIWHAHDLLGPWRPHACNPVKVDISSSRPAGTPFRHDGCLYRPAQDCSKSILRADRIVLNRVARLTPTDFKEEPAATIDPYANERYADAIHTVSAVGNLTVVDGRGLRFVPSAFGRAVTRGSIEMIRSVSGR